MANFAALGINGPRVVNALPSAITYAPESVRKKMANFAALGVHGATVVNAFPPAIGCATAKIALIVATLREGQCWDQVRERWNAGRDCSLLATPVESFLLYLGKEPDRFRQRPHGAGSFTRGSLGLSTSALRRAELLALLGSDGEADETFVANVGEAGALYLERAMREGSFEDANQLSLADQTERSLPTRSTPSLGSL